MTTTMDLEQLKARPTALLSGGQATMPLIDGLGATYNLAFLHPSAIEQAAQRGHVVADLRKFMTPEVQRLAQSKALALMTSYLVALQGGTLARSTNRLFHGYGFDSGPLSETFDEWLSWRVYEAMTRLVLRGMLFSQFHADFPVRVVIVHDDVMEETKGTARFFRERGVPTLHVPHAVYADLWYPSVIGNDVHDEVTCEWIAAIGQFQRDWYVARGADPERTVVTGSPQWDMWAKPIDRAWARTALKLAQDRPVVTYIATWTQQTNACARGDVELERGYRAFLEASKGAGWQAVVKLHPNGASENWQWHRKIAEEMDASAVLVVHYLDLVVGASDLMVSYGASNLVTEAAIQGVPSVALYGFPDDRAVPTVDESGLQAAIEEGLSLAWREEYGKLRNGFVEKYAGFGDGKSTERVLALIERMTGIATTHSA